MITTDGSSEPPPQNTSSSTPSSSDTDQGTRGDSLSAEYMRLTQAEVNRIHLYLRDTAVMRMNGAGLSFNSTQEVPRRIRTVSSHGTLDPLSLEPYETLPDGDL